MADPATITVLSLCSGYGGLELGLARALANPLRVVAVEIEAFALANLEAKASEGRLAVEALWPDLRTFPAERFRGCFDCVVAGYPCQPFSCAGKRAGADDPRHVWPHIAAIVRAVEPFSCFFENVPGHLTLGFPAVYRSLRDMGYSVEAGLFTAAEVGAPHKRQRLFILAHTRRDGGAGRGVPRDLACPTGRIEGDGEQWERLRDTACNGSAVVADAERPESRAGDGQEPSAGQWRNRPAIGRESLADPSGAELSGRQSKPGDDGLQLAPLAGGRDLWPAGPGQPQYDWEEPRIVMEHAPRRRAKPEEQPGQWAGQGSLEPSVGQSVDGRPGRLVRSRVDQLRLLGNGVVPAQAEMAFRVLFSEIANRNS